jgi:hypothetical protein
MEFGIRSQGSKNEHRKEKSNSLEFYSIASVLGSINLGICRRLQYCILDCGSQLAGCSQHNDLAFAFI